MTDEYSAALQLHRSSSIYFERTAIRDIDASVFGRMDQEQISIAFCHHLLRLNGFFIRAIWLSHIPIPESEWNALCLTAVNQNGLALACLNPQHITPELVLAATRQNPSAFEGLILPRGSYSAEVCEIAVRHNGLLLRTVPEIVITPSLCCLAVQQNWRAVVYIPDSMSRRYADAISRAASVHE